jgi:CHASE3 domain sensor protein
MPPLSDPDKPARNPVVERAIHTHLAQLKARQTLRAIEDEVLDIEKDNRTQRFGNRLALSLILVGAALVLVLGVVTLW